MKHIAPFLVSIIFLIIGASAYADDEINVVIFGDSLTSGYQLQPDEAFDIKLKKKLTDIGFVNVKITNLSIASDSTSDAVKRLNTVFLERPHVVVVALGLNDAVRGIATNIIYSNVAFIVAQLKQKNIYTILLGVKAPAGQGNIYDQQLESSFATIAQTYRLPFYPNALEGIAEKSKYTVADGYRPNAQGVDIMVEGMYRLVDAGLRWTYQVLEYQNQYRRSQLPQDGR